MGYAIKSATCWRAVGSMEDILPGETYSETVPDEQNTEQGIRQPVAATIQILQNDLALAQLSANQPAINRIRREISRLKFMSPGV